MGKERREGKGQERDSFFFINSLKKSIQLIFNNQSALLSIIALFLPSNLTNFDICFFKHSQL